MVDKILEKFGLNYDDLTKAERDTYHQMLDSVQKSQLTIDGLKDYIHEMRNQVESELTRSTIKRPSFFGFMFMFRKDVALKARLRNYLLLEAFLDSPKKAEKALEQAIASLGRKGL